MIARLRERRNAVEFHRPCDYGGDLRVCLPELMNLPNEKPAGEGGLLHI
jgi:hypothetical protein